jgi:DNA polymerase V
MLFDDSTINSINVLKTQINEVRSKYGANILFTGKNMLEGATQLERNGQIGGHKK